jgi:DNA-binding transcriptional regulator LsrR (DeoR family)
MRKPVVKSRHQQLVEAQLGEAIEVALHREYVVEGRSQAEIAERWGVSRQAVVRWMQQADIASRQAPLVAPEAIA